MDELFECLVLIFGFLYIFKWLLEFLVKKFHLHTGIFTIEGNQLVVRALFSVRYEKNKIATIIFSCMHSWRIPWAHAGKMLIIMKDGTRSGPFQFDSGSLTGEFCPILDSGEDIERTIAYLREELKDMVFLLSIGNNGRRKKWENGLKRQQKMFISGV